MKKKKITRWLSRDRGLLVSCVCFWAKEPHMDTYGRYVNFDGWRGKLKIREFKLFYPNIPLPKPHECFEVTFK